MKLDWMISGGLLVIAGSGMVLGDEPATAAGQAILTVQGQTIKADQLWSTIQGLQKASAPAWKPADLDQELRAWRCHTLDLYRRLGLRFVAAFPTDVRRWEWLAQTANDETVYQTECADPHRLADWSRQRAELVRQCLEAEDATEEQKLTIGWTDAHRRVVLARRQNVDEMDFAAMQEAVLDLGRRFPTITDYRMEMPLDFLLDMERRDVSPPETFISALAENPNPVLRGMAKNLMAMEAIRQKPMELRFTAIDDREVDLGTLRGKVVLVNFTGITWCYGCRLQEPFLKAAYEKYHDLGFEIISITNEAEGKRAMVLQKLKENDLPWPHYFDGKGLDNPYIRQYGIRGFPTHFLLDRNGCLVSTAAYGDRLDPMISRYLELPGRAAGGN